MIDENLLQKLVDGELSNEQIRSILRDADQADQNCETSPSQRETFTWKQVAVSFAENQMIQRAFSDFDSSMLMTDEAESLADSPREINSLGRPARTATGSLRTNSSFRTMWTFAAAASLLIGVSLFYQHFSNSNKADMSSVVASTNSMEPEDHSAEPLLNFDRTTLLTLTPDHQLESSQLPASFGQKVRQQVPMFDAKRFDKRQLAGLRVNDQAARRAWVDEVMPASGVTDELMADYEKAGLMVDQDIEFLSGRLDDGRAYMIPYRTVRFSAGQ